MNSSVLTVNASQTQTIEGFGGAFTDSAAHVFFSMPPKLQEQLLQAYFGEDGLEVQHGEIDDRDRAISHRVL